MSHSLYPDKVKLRQEDHKYFHENGDEYMSFSKLSHKLIPEFNAEMISKKVAESRGVSQSEVLNEWNGRRDNGTRIDQAIETYANDGLVFSENIDIADLIKSVNEEYKDYHGSFHQLVLYSEQYRIAGSCDKLFVFGNRKDSNFGISDFKAYEKPEELTKVRGWCKAPFNHLPNSKFTKICFQLGIYSFMFEQLTGRRCKELFIHVIDSVNNTHKKVHIPYLKNDIAVLLNTYKEEILNDLTPQSVF